jgi:hypothetical protein
MRETRQGRSYFPTRSPLVVPHTFSSSPTATSLRQQLTGSYGVHASERQPTPIAPTPASMSPTPFPLIHAHLLVKRLLKLNPSSCPAFHYIYVLGEKTQCRNDTDRELPFRQESNFAWLSGGVDVPGSALTISYEHEGGEFDEAKLTTALYLPEVEAAEVMYVHLDPTAARR